MAGEWVRVPRLTGRRPGMAGGRVVLLSPVRRRPGYGRARRPSQVTALGQGVRVLRHARHPLGSAPPHPGSEAALLQPDSRASSSSPSASGSAFTTASCLSRREWRCEAPLLRPLKYAAAARIEQLLQRAAKCDSMLRTVCSGRVCMAPQPLPASTRSPSRWDLAALLAAFVLLWAELFLTAAADEPNTWSGVITDTIALGIGGGIALGLAALATNKRRARSAAIGCFVAALLFALPFWTGAVIVLGVTAYILNRGERQVLAYIAAGLAVLDAVFCWCPSSSTSRPVCLPSPIPSPQQLVGPLWRRAVDTCDLTFDAEVSTRAYPVVVRPDRDARRARTALIATRPGRARRVGISYVIYSRPHEGELFGPDRHVDS